VDDLQLLELLEKAQKKQRGPQGQPGVSIESIEQFDELSFTLRLSDGSFKKVSLPAPIKGDTGDQGNEGQKGDIGSPGRDGKNGADALDGSPGLPGPAGVSVGTAVVNGNGELLLGLTDGTLVNVGSVVGPAGATGASGPKGLPGVDGKDGAAVLSGPRAPQQSDGSEGDFWIDISSASFGFYKKSGSGWSKQADLRQPAKDMRVGAGAGGGGGSGGSGGGGTAQTTRTLPLANAGGTLRKKAQAKELPPVPGKLETQEDANLYFLDALSKLPGSLDDYATEEWTEQKIAEAQLEAECGVLIKSEWDIILSGSSSPGKVMLYTSGLQGGVVAWTDVAFIGFVNPDKNGVSYDFSDIPAGANIRLTRSDNSIDGCTFKIGANSDASIGLFQVESVVVEAGAPAHETAYRIDFLSGIEGGDVDLSNYLTIYAFNEGQDEQNLITTENSKAIVQNALDIAELEITKGSVARYKLEDTVLEVASRRGEFYTNANKASDVTIMSFASLDLNGNTTKPVNDGDIIEFDTGSSILRYTAGGSSIEALPVTYTDGSHSFSSGQEMDVYIYPQNKQGASKDYVDAQDDLLYPKTGGFITGPIKVQVDSPSSQTCYAIYEPEGTRTYYIWNPGGLGENIKHVCMDGSDFEISATAIVGEVRKTASPAIFGYQNIILSGGTIRPQGASQDVAVSHKIDTEHTFQGKATFEPASAGSDGFTVKGNSDIPDDKLLSVYHHQGGATRDSINYGGGTTSASNIQTKESVEALIEAKGGGGMNMQTGTLTSPTLATGEMYWNTNKQVLYIGN